MNALITRRALLRGGLAVGAGLTVGFPVARGARGAALAQTAGVFAPNQWLRIDRDGVVTIVNSVPEMGQGSLTTTSMIIADELDAILDKVRYIGKPVKRRDTPEKITGRGIYGTDVQVPGMLVASIERCPVFGGKVKSFDATAATRVKGVKHVVQVSNGIAVVADGFWTALQGRRALRVTWDEGPMAQVSSTMITREYEAAAKQPGQVARNDGDAEKVLAAGGRVHEAVYQVPFLEHACMEPMNATAQVMPDACVVWAPTQNPGGTQATAARLTGLPPEKVTVHTTLLGGGFGRRGEQDFIVDAVETSKAVGAPVKVMWTREDDITHGFYRPATYNLFRATLDARGVPAAWFTRMVGPGILIQKGRAQAGTIDAAAVEAVRNMPYDVPNLRIEWTNKDLGIPLGFWRSVGPSQNGFIIESFIDELAHLAGKDPYEYRRALLGKAPRHKAVLELAATRANWGAPLPTGHTRGIAVAFSYGSYVAHVAEVSVARDGAVRTHRLVAAIDAGLAVNPENVKAQMEGGAVYALTAALYGRITIDRGRVQQSNFHDYPMLRINEMPVVEVHILDSGEAPGGLGEPRAHRRARGVQRDLRGDGQAYPHPADQSRRAEARVSRRRVAVRSPASVLR